MNVIRVPKLYKCEMCKKVCKSKQHLQKHMHYIHTSTRTYDCEFCGHQEYLKGNLDRHYKSCKKAVENGIKIQMFSCPHCDKSFKQNGNLHTHMMRHHGVGKPSTRVDRNKTRKLFMQNNLRFVTCEDKSIKRPKRFTIHDSLQNNEVVFYFSNHVSQRNANIIADNLNIIFGLIQNQTQHEFNYHWKNIQDAVESLQNDRPKQASVIEDAYQVIQTIIEFNQ